MEMACSLKRLANFSTSSFVSWKNRLNLIAVCSLFEKSLGTVNSLLSGVHTTNSWHTCWQTVGDMQIELVSILANIFTNFFLLLVFDV